MQLNQRSFRIVASAIFTILALTMISQAQDVATQNNHLVKIKNFGQLDERFYRGAQPKEQDYKDLAALGIKTVIDLTADPKPYERSRVESLGMKYINIPMIEKKYPTEEATRMFLKVAADPSTGKFSSTVPAADIAPERWAPSIATSSMIGILNRSTPR